RRDQLFDRFYQAHGEGHFGGLGLGLFISRQIVELHGGRISAEFPTDGGTRFVVELPLGSAASGADGAPESASGAVKALGPAAAGSCAAGAGGRRTPAHARERPRVLHPPRLAG